MVQTIEWYTKEEKQLVIQLRDLVRDKLPQEELKKSEDDQTAFFLRWLRARNLNLDKSSEMLLTALKWRQENNVDKILEVEIDPFFPKTYRWSIAGSDKEGRPVSVHPFYEWDFRKVFDNEKMDMFDLFMNNFFEVFVERIHYNNERREAGQPPITQFFPVLDVNGYPYGQMLSFRAMKKWFHMAATYEAYYPEVLFKVVCINCPPWFQLFLNMFKGFLAPRTLNKFMCYNTVQDWQKDMGDYLDPAILPEQYGGTRTIPLENLEISNKNLGVKGK